MGQNGELGELVVRIGADTTNFAQGMGQLNQQMRLLQSRLQANTSGLQGTENNFNRLRETAINLSQQFNIQRQRLDALRQAHAQLVTAQGADSRAALEMEIRINRETASLNELENRIRDTNEQLRLQASRWHQASQAMNTAAVRMQAVGQKLAGIGRSLTTYVTMPIIAAGVASIKMASDTSESINKVEVAFKESASIVKEWANTTLKSYGVARGTALDMASLFGDMATSMGFSTKRATDMSTKLVGLAADLSSFKNISMDVAKTALNAIFTGETESLKMLGVVMTETNLQEYALAEGIRKKVNEMTQAEKVTLRYKYVLDMTKNAQGDFARTSNSTANQIRLFQESIKQLGDNIGQKLLPAVTPLIQKLNSLIEKFSKLNPKTQETIIKIAAIAAAVGPVILVIGNLVIAIGGIVSAVGTVTAAIAGAGGLAAVLGAIAAPAGVIAAVGFSLIVLIRHFNDIKDAISGAIEKLKHWNDTPVNVKNVVKQPNPNYSGQAIIFGSEPKEKAPVKLKPLSVKIDPKTGAIDLSDVLKNIPSTKQITKPVQDKKTEKKIDTTTFDQALEEYEYLKHLGKLTYSQEISSLQNIGRKYAYSVQEKRQIEMMLYDLKKEHAQSLGKSDDSRDKAQIKKFNEQVKKYTQLTKAHKLSYEQEIRFLNDIVKKYAKTVDQKTQIEAVLYNLKQNHEKALQAQKEKNLKKQQELYDGQLTALEKIQRLYEKNKKNVADNQHIDYLKDRIKKSNDNLERAGLQNELDKFMKEVNETKVSGVFDVVKDKITGLKENLGLSTVQLAQKAKDATAAMNSTIKMMRSEGVTFHINGQMMPAIAGVPNGNGTQATNVTNEYHITIDAKNVKEFNDVVALVKAIPTSKKKR